LEQQSVLASLTLHISNDLFAFGKSRRIGFLPWHRDRRQKVERNSERPGDLLMQFERAFAIAGFQV
jgi:hypothetical protein